MSVMEQLMEKSRISRRGFLQAAGALSATAALYGCGGGDGGENSKIDNATVIPKDNLVMDKEMKTVMQCHPFNCGSRCTFKFHVKNGRMLKLTSAGDIPRAGSETSDERLDLIQRRACPRGFAQIKRNYQPDRLKYPMKQTKERGDYTGFVRITWEEAFQTIADNYKKTIARKDKLGYIPGSGSFNNPIFQYFGVSLAPQGAPSYENLANAMFGSIGLFAEGNDVPDLLNSKFILNLGVDATVSFSWQPHIFWYLTKAKEKGIPIVTLETNTTDTITALSNGYSQYNLPPFVAVRPMSDSAVLAAMANVIYRNNLHDKSFTKDYCFGFYPGDTATKGGTTYVTPPGMSFIEYLDGLESGKERGVADNPAMVGTKAGYDAVLQWASELSGVAPETIDNLGKAYGSTKPALLLGGFGPARSNNGMHYGMLCVALAAMTGNTQKRGGGLGYAGVSFSRNPFILGATKEPVTNAVPVASAANPFDYKNIGYSINCIGKVIKYGIDNRDPAQLWFDTKYVNGKVDLGQWKAQRDDVNGNDGRLRIEMIAFDGNHVNQRGPINPLLIAIKTRDIVKFTYGMDNFMTPTMAYCDIVLPQTTHLEEDRIETGFGLISASWFMNKVCEPMYECKTTNEINGGILKKLGIDYGPYGPQGSKTQLELLREQWEKVTVNPRYTAIDPSFKLPTFDEFRAQGIIEFPVPPEKALAGSATTAKPGEFATPDTGKINFFSPYYFYKDQPLGDTYKKPDGGYYRTMYPPKAMYAPPIQGYSDVLKGTNIGAKGVPYTLQIKTSHHRRRAHSVYDNVAILRDTFPGELILNTVDAAARGINNGDIVYAYNDWGCVKVQCIVTKRIRQGVVNLSDGEWYRPSPTETYESWIDMNGDGVAEKYVVPVDVGGAPNSLMHFWEMGPKDPVTTNCGDNNWNGHLVEVSKTHPDKK